MNSYIGRCRLAKIINFSKLIANHGSRRNLNSINKVVILAQFGCDPLDDGAISSSDNKVESLQHKVLYKNAKKKENNLLRQMSTEIFKYRTSWNIVAPMSSG